jgi:tRNA A37 methylthiotransferase MiaB
LIEERHQRCLELIDRIAFGKRSALLGTIQDVLVEEENFGRTRTNHKVHIEGQFQSGEHVRVRITNAQRATLQGESDNGNFTFQNFRQEDRGRAGARF